MENEIFIPPFVGELYGKTEGFFKGVRVLAIGNSHYCKEHPKNHNDILNRCGKNCKHYMKPGKCGNVNTNPPRQNSFTIDVVEEYIDYKNGKCKHKAWYNTFTKFARIFSNNTNWIDDKLVWESMCLYNFLDVAVENPNAAGTKIEIEDAKTKILPVIINCKPDVIVVWGEKNGLFNHLLEEFKNIKWIPMLNNNRCGELVIDDIKIKVVCIDHPSARKGDYKNNARSIISCIVPELLNK